MREFSVILHLSAHNELSAYVLGERDNYLSAYSCKWLCIGAMLHLNKSMHMAGMAEGCENGGGELNNETAVV